MNEHTDDELHGFEEIEALLREADADDATLFEPPTDLWAAIEASIAPTVVAPPAAVTHLADRRRRTTWLGAAAAAVVLVVAGALVFTVVRSGSDSEPIIARAQLTWDASAFDPLGADATATAELTGDDSGYTIDIDEAQLPELAVDGDALELWLIQPDAENNPAALVSLGTFDAASSRFEVPEGFDPDEYFVVDISVEPGDGNPAHSGRSILRGALVRA